MKVLLKELLPAWAWILGCGFLVSLMSAISNRFFLGEISSNFVLLGIFLIYSIVMALICVSVFLYRNLKLKGIISFWAAFSMIILIFITTIVVYEPISKFFYDGSYSQKVDEYTRYRYSSDEDGSFYDSAFEFDNKIKAALFLFFNAFLIAKIASAKTPSVSRDILDDFNS
jgi:hypothetical protein